MRRMAEGALSRRTGFEGLVLAAGRGSRFGDDSLDSMPKVLRPLLEVAMVVYVLDVMESVGVHDVFMVVGHRAREVQEAVGSRARYVLQEELNGSGHAVACARDSFADFEGHLIVMCGDSPLFTPKSITRLMRTHVKTGAVMTLASAVLEDPTGYGRILRGESGEVIGVVEEACASEEQRGVREVNGGAYLFDARWLFGNIDLMQANESGEFNLTDMARVAAEQHRVVAAQECDPREIRGVNTPADVLEAERILRRRQRRSRRRELRDQEEDNTG